MVIRSIVSAVWFTVVAVGPGALLNAQSARPATQVPIEADRISSESWVCSKGITKSRPAGGRFVKVADGFMVPYEQELPGSRTAIRMQPIPAGKLVVPEEVAGGRRETVEIHPMWVAEHEVSWGQYTKFMSLYRGIKEIAHDYGIIPTFMAKITPELPGCSGHIHQSLWDDKKNLFHDAKGNKGMSKLMESYMAGQLACLPYILPLIAPTINSYKRLVEGAWAPTTLTWAVDNRTVALRSLPAGEKSCRLETRVVGSDTNPYLAMSACLAAGLYGIENNLKLKLPETVGNGYEDKGAGTLPRNLWEATQAMKDSDIAKSLFGEDFVNHFVSSREWEWREFSKAVTDWETKRYFEII